jgi:hypothetical protein
VRAEQQYFGLASTALACSDEIGAANSENVVVQPQRGIALLPPFIFDVSGCTLEGIRHEHIALAYISGKPLDVSAKARERFFRLHRFSDEFDASREFDASSRAD